MQTSSKAAQAITGKYVRKAVSQRIEYVAAMQTLFIVSVNLDTHKVTASATHNTWNVESQDRYGIE